MARSSKRLSGTSTKVTLLPAPSANSVTPSGMTEMMLPEVNGTPWHQLASASTLCRQPSRHQSSGSTKRPRARAPIWKVHSKAWSCTNEVTAAVGGWSSSSTNST